MASHLEWNVGNINGTCLVGYLDHGDFDATVERLKALGAEDEGPGDKTTVEFRGRFNGAVFTLYDYYEGRRLHIGGHADGDTLFGTGPALDVEGLKAHLARWFALPEVVDARTLLWPTSK